MWRQHPSEMVLLKELAVERQQVVWCNTNVHHYYLPIPRNPFKYR